MGNQQIPLSDLMCLSVHGGNLPPIGGLDGIAKDVPLRMTTRTFLQIAAVGLMAQFSELFAYSLAFFTGN
jgi:hypothetical protein